METSQRTWMARLLVAATTIAALLIMVSPAVGAQVETTETISLYVRQSRVINAPWPVARMSVTDPEIADVQMLTPDRILVQSKAIGSTDLILWSKDEKTWEARIDVSVDFRRMKDELTKLFPYSKLNVTQAQDVIVISGTLGRAEHAAQLRRFMEASKEASDLVYVDMTSIAGVQQVMLKVRIAEVSRTALRQLGINWFHTNNDYFVGQTVGSAQGGPLNPFAIGVAEGTSASLSRTPMIFTADAANSAAVTLFGGFPELSLEYFIQALAENQYLRVLAEPTLVALSGQEAKFLVGGEFPIPVVQGTSVGQGSTVTIEWKQFGVLLQFRPTVLGDGTIRLHLAPEVSETSELNAVTSGGFLIPSVIQRKAETTLEMKSGQTFAMAGLLRRVNDARNSRIPGLGDIPIIGSLFRSVRYTSQETDLVILVTASLVEPMNVAGDLPVPGDTHTAPTDWELYSLGRIEGETAGKLSPAHQDWLKRRGLDRLKGPGAWVTYETPPARSTAQIKAIPAEPMPAIESPAPTAEAAKDDKAADKSPAPTTEAAKDDKAADKSPAPTAEAAKDDKTADKSPDANSEIAADSSGADSDAPVDKNEATADPPETGVEATSEAAEAASSKSESTPIFEEITTDATSPAKLPDAEEMAGESA